jgi:nicotinate-nucleotide adenylyltransferase
MPQPPQAQSLPQARQSAPPPRRLGVLGGTFNPPHLGHLALARCALDQLGLERVLLVPSCVPPHKQAEADPGAEHRLRMCELAVAGASGLEACPLEVQRGGPSYTVDTLLALRSLYPDASLTLILGSDIARTLPSWHRPDEVVALARIAVAAREGDEVQGDAAVECPGDAALAPAMLAGAVRLELPVLPISSSLVRARVAGGEPLDGLVPPAVAAYIAEHSLYAVADTAEVRAQ